MSDKELTYVDKNGQATGWWCEACGKFVTKNFGGDKCWLCEPCSIADVVTDEAWEMRNLYKGE